MRLNVYIEKGCMICERALAIAQEIDDEYPTMTVRIVDMAENDEQDDVFAVPTFVLNGDVISLGNPKRVDLHRAIEAALQSSRLNS